MQVKSLIIKFEAYKTKYNKTTHTKTEGQHA